MQTLASPSATNFPRLERQPLKIVALGDSLVYGFGDPEGGGWVERLRRQWMMPGSAGHVLYNLGVRGDRVAQVAQRLEIEFRHRGELRNRVPDAIVLSVGVNDSARLRQPDGRPFTPADRFQQQLEDLLDRARDLCPVFFVGMVPVNEAKMPFLDCLYYQHAEQYRYKEMARLACDRRGIPYLDLYEAWMARGLDWVRSRLGEDGLHPNILGYRSLLDDVANWHPIAELAAA